MKKFIIWLLSFCFILANTFAYNSTPKDEAILKVFNSKIDIIYNKNPDKINNFYIILKNLRDKKVKNTRIYFLLWKLVEHIDWLLNKEKKAELKKEKIQKDFETSLEWQKEGSQKKLEWKKKIYKTKLDKYFNPYDKSYLNKWYTCWKKQYCKYMSSCEEVKYYYYKCWVKRFDRDWDWIPCENVCGNKYIK